MMALCEKKSGSHAVALQLLNTCIEKFPGFTEA